MNFEEKGRILALLKNDDEKDRKKWEKLFLTSTPAEVRGGAFRDVKLKDKPSLHFQPIPDKNIERSITYITGASGSGKSFYTKMYVDEYKRLYPKREVFLISSLSDDSSIDKIKGLNRIKMNEKFLTTEISAKDFKDCCVIFDDTDCLTDKRYRLKVAEVLNSLLETGRHFNCEVIYTSHLATDGHATKRILNECKSVVIFPSGLGGRSIKYLLDNYFGLDREQIKRIKKLNSRWVCINKGFPMSVLSDKEAYVLNDPDEEED
jgi:hypothetical protein